MTSTTNEQKCTILEEMLKERTRQNHELVRFLDRLAVHSGQEKRLTAAGWIQASAQVDQWAMHMEYCATELPHIEAVLSSAAERGIIEEQSTVSLNAAELVNRIYELMEENTRLRNQLEDHLDEQDAVHDELRRAFRGATIGSGHGAVSILDLVRSLVDHALGVKRRDQCSWWQKLPWRRAA